MKALILLALFIVSLALSSTAEAFGQCAGGSCSRFGRLFPNQDRKENRGERFRLREVRVLPRNR